MHGIPHNLDLSHTYVFTVCILFFETHLQCIYYRCLQQNCSQSQKPAGFCYPRGCRWDSCSYKLNRCYWSPLRATLFLHCLFPFVFLSLYIQVLSSISLISFMKHICYVSSNFNRLKTYMGKQTDFFIIIIGLHAVQLHTKKNNRYLHLIFYFKRESSDSAEGIL